MSTIFKFCLYSYLILTFVHSSNSYAWFCESTASIRNGDTIQGCGIGLGESRFDAQQDAIHKAYQEIDKICRPSYDCNRYEWSNVTPMRNECSLTKNGTGYICYRGVQVSISTIEREDMQSPRSYEDAGKIVLVSAKHKVMEVNSLEYLPKRIVSNFSTNPEGAQLFLDGILLCERTPCSKAITLGEHQIQILGLKNYEVIKKRITVGQKEDKFHYNLAFLKGILRFRGDYPEKTEFFINNQQIQNFLTDQILDPGEYVIEIRNPYFDPDVQVVSFKKGEVKEINFKNNALYSTFILEAQDIHGNDLAMSISIDGNTIGEKTPTQIKVKAGVHQIELSKGVLHKEFEVEFLPNTTVNKKIIFNAEDEENKRLLEEKYGDFKYWMISLGASGSLQSDLVEEKLTDTTIETSLGLMIAPKWQLRLDGFFFARDGKKNVNKEYSSRYYSDSEEKLLDKEVDGGLGRLITPFYITPGLYIGPFVGYGVYQLTYRKNTIKVPFGQYMLESKIKVPVWIYGAEMGYLYIINQWHGPRAALGYKQTNVLSTKGYNANYNLGFPKYHGRKQPYLSLAWEWRF